MLNDPINFFSDRLREVTETTGPEGFTCPAVLLVPKAPRQLRT